MGNLSLLARLHELLGAQLPLTACRLLTLDLLLLAHLASGFLRHLSHQQSTVKSTLLAKRASFSTVRHTSIAIRMDSMHSIN